VKTSSVSNATANLTLSASPSGSLMSGVFEPSLNFWSFLNLDETQTTTVSVTFLPGQTETRLDIDFIKISVSNSSATSSFLPTPTLPTAAFTPTFASFTTVATSESPSTSREQPIGTIIGESLAGAFGLIAVGLVAFVFWRRRRRQEELRRTTMQVQAASQVMAQVPPTPDRSRRRGEPSSAMGSVFAEDGH